MRLHLLGIYGPYPAALGATSGYLLEAGGKTLQFDAGSGTLGRLTALMPPEDLDALFISHWHFDHTADLLPLIYRLQAVGRRLKLYGPADDTSALRRVAEQAGCFDLTTVAPGEEISLGADLRVMVGPARHPVAGVGYRVENGGRALGYTGDTNTLPGLENFYRGVDLLLADGLFPTEEWGENKPHLSAALAARLARDCGAGTLVLTHLNPAYAPELLLRQAREVYPETEIARMGAVHSL